MNYELEQFIRLHQGSKIVDSELHRYVLRRDAAEDAVKGQIMSTGGEARGSWETGLFHLDVQDSKTLSDVDAFNSRGRAHYNTEILVETEWDQLNLQMSVHPFDYQTGLSLSTQKAMAVANLAMHDETSESNWTYQLAKALLTLWRETSGETYLQTATRTGNDLLYSCLACKLGFENRIEISFEDICYALQHNKIEWAPARPRDVKSLSIAAAYELDDNPDVRPAPYLHRYLLHKYRSDLDED